MTNLKNLKMDHFPRSNIFRRQNKYLSFYSSRRVSVKQENNEAKPEKNEEKEKEKKKETNWLKPKSIIKKYVLFYDFLQLEWS